MSKTLIGKKGYLFLQNDSARELEVHKDNLNLVNILSMNKYDFINNKFLIIIFPNKSFLYKEYLPDDIILKYRPAFDIYKNYFGENLLDGYEILKYEENTFYKTDTHINLKGSYIIYCEFIKKINLLFNLDIETINLLLDNKVCQLSNLNLGIGDLTWKQNLGDLVLDNIDDSYFYSDNLELIYLRYKIDENSKIKLLYLENNNLVDKTLDKLNSIIEWDIVSKYILFKKNSNKKYRILIFYDSFLLSTLSLYLDMFKEVYMSKSIFNEKLIKIINPDYVFEFRVERFLF